jgi:hypothetical protein
MMTEVMLSTSPHRRHASLVTAGCAARRNVPTAGSRTWRSGERKDATGHRVTTDKPRDGKRAKAADRR